MRQYTMISKDPMCRVAVLDEPVLSEWLTCSACDPLVNDIDQLAKNVLATGPEQIRGLSPPTTCHHKLPS